MKYRIEVPTDLNDLTVRQFINYQRIEEPTKEDLLVCFLELNRKDVRNLKASSFEILSERILTLLEAPKKLIPVFEMNGKKYGFEPNLDEITFGVNEDATSYLGDIEDINKALAVLYRPVVKRLKSKYTIEPYEGTGDRAELFLDAPLGVALGMQVFFYNLMTDLLTITLNSTQEQLQAEIQALESEKGSLKNGTVTKSSLLLVKEIFEGLTKFQDSTYISALLT